MRQQQLDSLPAVASLLAHSVHQQVCLERCIKWQSMPVFAPAVLSCILH
jgi:hypothetical protein